MTGRRQDEILKRFTERYCCRIPRPRSRGAESHWRHSSGKRLHHCHAGGTPHRSPALEARDVATRYRRRTRLAGAVHRGKKRMRGRCHRHSSRAGLEGHLRPGMVRVSACRADTGGRNDRWPDPDRNADRASCGPLVHYAEAVPAHNAGFLDAGGHLPDRFAEDLDLKGEACTGG